MAEERPRPLRDLGVIDQNKRLRQLANIPGSDETRDHTMPATIREQCDAARIGRHGADGRRVRGNRAHPHCMNQPWLTISD
jgi:hypothetical protein